MVEGGELKLSANDSDRAPLVARVADAGDAYVLRARIRCYAGPTHRVSVVMRYRDPGAFARVWLHDSGTIHYQECLRGLLSGSRPVGTAPIVDDAWHEWEVAVDGREVGVTIDGKAVGRVLSSEALMRRCRPTRCTSGSWSMTRASAGDVQVGSETAALWDRLSGWKARPTRARCVRGEMSVGGLEGPKSPAPPVDQDDRPTNGGAPSVGR